MDETMTEIITELFPDGVLRVEMNRPDRKNAMTGAMYSGLAAILNEADRNDAVRVVLWYGAGGDFTAGNDIVDFQENPPQDEDSPQSRLTREFIKFGKPLVAAVRGAAVGGGTTMLTHCDFVYASENTRFQVPFINLALTPEFASSFSIPARAGYLGAAELYLLGEPFSATRAAELGLVTRVVPDADLLATATATARKLAAKPAGALKAHKQLLKRASIEPLRAAATAEGREFAERVISSEAREAFSAFLQKRAPDFRKVA
jgi:enoyl-CoA hydratase/carnithine racemase